MIAVDTNNPPHLSDAALKEAFYGPATEAVDNSPRAARLRRVNAARAMLLRKGYNAKSPVFVTAAAFTDDRDLNEVEADLPSPQVCEVTAHYAAYLIADRSHRLSTPEEVERFYREQKEREEACASIERRNPNNKTVHQTITYMMQPGEAIKAGLPATPDAPARVGRNVGAGNQEKN